MRVWTIRLFLIRDIVRDFFVLGYEQPECCKRKEIFRLA